jgi:hypothetical protein
MYERSTHLTKKDAFDSSDDLETIDSTGRPSPGPSGSEEESLESSLSSLSW